MDQVFLSDQPAIEDEFGRRRFAERIARLIQERRDRDPLVVAICGPWGDGKSTVLNFVYDTLDRSSECVAVKFNPWRFRSEEELLPVFFATLADALGKSVEGAGQKVGAAVRKYAKYFRPLSVVVQAVAGVDAAGALDQFGKDLSASDIEKDKEAVNELLRDAGKKFVVMMDDIDRLDNAEIRTVFKMVKLTADFVNTNYVLAFDDDVVAAALGQSYASGGATDGRAFLEKIVQVELQLPRISPEELAKFFFRLFDLAIPAQQRKLTADELQRFGNHFRNDLQPRLHTPRMCKRYVNALCFAIGLLGDQVNQFDLVILEGIRLFFPDLYDAIRAHRTVSLGAALLQQENHPYLSVAKQGDDLLARTTGHMSLAERLAARRLLDAILPNYGVESRGAGCEGTRSIDKQARRLCTPDCFDRFFAYAGGTGI